MKKIITCIWIAMSTFVVFGKQIIDFKQTDPPAFLKLDNKAEIKNGRLHYNRGETKHYHTRLAIPVPQAEAYEIKLKMRVYNPDSQAKYCRIMFKLIGEKQNNSLLTFSDGTGFFNILRCGKKNQFYKHHKGKGDITRIKEKNIWRTFKFIIDRDTVDFFCNDQLLYSETNLGIAPFKELIFENTAYSVEIEHIIISKIKSSKAPDQAVFWDFSTPPDRRVAQLGKETKVENDVLKFETKGHNYFKIFRSYTRPFQMDFKLKMVQRKSGNSWLMLKFIAQKTNTTLLLFNTRKNSNGLFAIYKEQGTQRFYDFQRCPFSNPEGIWKNIQLQVSNRTIELYINGKPVFNKQTNILPLKEISFSANGCTVEFDDIKITPAEKGQSNFQTKAVLTSTFNDSSMQLNNSDGKKITPSSGKAIKASGISGQGSKVTSPLIFPAQDIFCNQAGCIMFWVSLKKVIWQRPLLICDDGKKNILSIYARARDIYASIKRKGNLPDYKIQLGLAPWESSNDWAHIALSWNQEEVRLYLNSMPYSTKHYDKSIIKALINPDIEGIKRIQFPANATYDDLKIYRRPVSPAEIYAEYRTKMPIDLVMQNQMFDGRNPIKMVLKTAPGGYYMRPMPVSCPYNSANVEIATVLSDKKNGKILQKTPFRKLKIDKQSDICLPELKLDNGNYLLTTEIKYNNALFRRSFAIDVFSSRYAKVIPSNSDIIKGKEIYSCNFYKATPHMLGRFKKVSNGELSYIEGSDNSFDRFSFEVKFPRNVMGKPVLIEIDWPDDKPRLMANYIYRPSKGYCDRDRLQQGIQSGVEYPLTGKIVTTTYIFWPGFDEYLFEFRNLAKGRPAAISALRIYEINGNLPALKVREPEGLQARSLGHLDEDQTYWMNLNRDYYDHYLRTKGQYPNYDCFVFDETVKYFAYAGMNSMLYNLLRYYFVFYMTDTNMPPGMSPTKAGGLDYMLEILKKNKITFYCGINISSIPETVHSRITEPKAIKKGWIMSDRTGQINGGMFGTRYPNFTTHPEIIRLYLRHIKEFASLLKSHKNVGGFALWTVPWRDLNWGYDDFNVNMFSLETGISVPKEKKKRYEYLTGEKRKEWLRWRADKTTSFLKKITEVIHRFNAQWDLIICPQDQKAFINPVTGEILDNTDLALSREKYYYENLGIDIKAIESLNKVFFAPIVMPSRSMVSLYKHNKQAPINELVYSYQADKSLFRRQGKSRRIAAVYHDYYESIGLRNPSPTQLPEKYSCFFQDTDVKPWGRYFLKELTYQVAASDAQDIVFGAQPLGALGRETETREFAQAYRALPAFPFVDVPGADDPVTVRYLQTRNGTYFYLASMLWTPCKVRINFADKEKQYMDLSTGQMNKSQEIELDVYQLRSFLIPDKKTTIKSVEVIVPQSLKIFYKKRINEIKRRIDTLGKIQGRKGLETERKILKSITREFTAAHYAEVHRLLFSVALQQFMNSTKNINLVAKKQRMLKKNHIAVNCGSDEYYLAPGGELFFPDRKFKENSIYGFFGQHKSCVRKIEGIREKRVPGVFKSEAWDIDGYKFRLPNGSYTLKLYMRFAYDPGFKKDRPLYFTLEAQGKVLFQGLNFYKAMKGDICNTVILEYKGIKVQDGLLTLKCVPGKDSTIRHFDAIEVVKEK